MKTILVPIILNILVFFLIGIILEMRKYLVFDRNLNWVCIFFFIVDLAVSLGLSCILSASMSLIIMAGMQVFKEHLIQTKLATLFAGYLGSLIFMLILTFISNLEMSMFGKQFQSKYTEGLFILFYFSTILTEHMFWIFLLQLLSVFLSQCFLLV